MFKDKVIIITGASSGIGKACAVEFAKMGAKVSLAARNTEKLSETEKLCMQFGGKVLIVKTDVSKESDCRNLIDQTIQTFGKIDILINNAGISMRALFQDLDLIVLKRLMDVNFWGTVYCTKFALPHLLESKGSAVGVISVAGFRGLPARTGYSASKFAIQGFFEALRSETLKTGLHVLIAAPGFTASNIRNTALVNDGSEQGESPRNEEKMMTAEKAAYYIVKAVRKRKRYVILTLQGKMTVLVNKFFPRFMDHMVYRNMAKEPDSPLK
jgi:dehydrogenase/reductase SDR family member 7B